MKNVISLSLCNLLPKKKKKLFNKINQKRTLPIFGQCIDSFRWIFYRDFYCSHCCCYLKKKYKFGFWILKRFLSQFLFSKLFILQNFKKKKNCFLFNLKVSWWKWNRIEWKWNCKNLFVYHRKNVVFSD